MGADWLDGGGSGGALDPAEVLGDLGNAGILDLVTAGALVSMGLTSDGGALGVTVTCDGRWRRDYFRQADELQAWLSEAVPAVEAARAAGSSARTNGGDASSGRGSRSRRR